MKNLKIFGQADERTIAQIQRCQEPEEGSLAVLCADNHLGYSQPIGGAIAYREHISPSGVGYDIGCGNKAVKTNIEVKAYLAGKGAPLAGSGMSLSKVMDEIAKRVSFGMGRNNNTPIDHPVLDQIREAPFEHQRKLIDLAARQLGTVGSGNHYLDLFAGDDGHLWIGVHFGSRGFGHKTASGFLAMAEGLGFDDHATEGEMDSPPVVFHVDSYLGEAYIEAMNLAGAYAYAGRDVVVDTVLEILGAQAEYEVHNHHNFAWNEEHNGENWWVVRKGCTPAFPGQQGFVGATMAEDSVILEGTNQGEDALFSTVHGAGRVMSRTAAKGKLKRRKVWTCRNRDCNWEMPSGKAQKPKACPQCSKPVGKTFREERKSKGMVDWEAERKNMNALGIELRGADADEAPPAYKRLDAVLEAHGDTIKVLHRLRPIGVAMAGPDIKDFYKD